MLRPFKCYAGCHYAEYRYAECRYAECRYAECRYAECHYAESRYAECRGALAVTSILVKRLPLHLPRSKILDYARSD